MPPLPDSQVVQVTLSIIYLGFYSGKKAERSSFSESNFMFDRRVKYVYLMMPFSGSHKADDAFSLASLITFPFAVLIRSK